MINYWKEVEYLLNHDSVLALYAKVGNYNAFARELRVDPSHLYRYLKTGHCGGTKIVQAIMRYCRDNNLDVYQYVVLD
jgi:hypothetical protein